MITVRSPASRSSGRSSSGRHVPPIDAAHAATALLGAISADGDRLDAVLRVVATEFRSSAERRGINSSVSRNNDSASFESP